MPRRHTLFALFALALVVSDSALAQGLFGRFRGGGGNSGACLDPASVSDRDVKRAAGTIAAAGLCVSEETVTDRGVSWRFITIADPKHRNGPVWYLPHDNENTAFSAALYAVQRYGGEMVALETGEGRTFRGIDPNRWFAARSADSAACRLSGATAAYTRHVMQLFKGQHAILTIHNNARGGGVSVNMRGAKTTGFRAGGSLSDPDHLVFIAGTQPIARDGAAQRQRDALLRAGLNVVHEEVSRQNNDCSLSNHAALNDRRPYYNIEATHGSRLQTTMVDRLMSVLGYRPVR